MKFHPFAEIFPLIEGDDFDHVFRDRPVICSTLAPWSTITVTPSSKHPGYWHVQRIDAASVCEETKRPMLKVAVAHLLRQWGSPSDPKRWREVDCTTNEGIVSLVAKQRANVVYFLQAGPFIKIGFTSGTPEARIDQLKTGCPYELRLLATIPGAQSLEREIHQRFRAARANLEWFHATPELLAFISTNGVRL